MQKTMIKPSETKNRSRLKHRSLSAGLNAVLSVLLLAGLMGGAGTGPARANSIQLKFNYTVLQGTCTLSFKDAGGAPISMIDFGDVEVSGTPQPFQALAGTNGSGTLRYTPFNIALDNCSGVADSNTAPVVSITGAHKYNNGATAANNDLAYMFRTSGGSDGLGVLLYKDGTGPGNSKDMADVTSGANDDRKYFTVPNNGKGSALNGSYIIPVSASIGCGSCGVTARAGDLSATVTFNFLYR